MSLLSCKPSNVSTHLSTSLTSAQISSPMPSTAQVQCLVYTLYTVIYIHWPHTDQAYFCPRALALAVAFAWNILLLDLPKASSLLIAQLKAFSREKPSLSTYSTPTTLYPITLSNVSVALFSLCLSSLLKGQTLSDSPALCCTCHEVETQFIE